MGDQLVFDPEAGGEDDSAIDRGDERAQPLGNRRAGDLPGRGKDFRSSLQFRKICVGQIAHREKIFYPSGQRCNPRYRGAAFGHVRRYSPLPWGSMLGEIKASMLQSSTEMLEENS